MVVNNTLHLVSYRQEEHLQVFPDDVWVNILGYHGAKSKKEYKTFLNTSKQLSYLITDNLHLCNKNLVLDLVGISPKKFSLLNPFFTTNAWFVTQVLKRTSLPWDHIGPFQNTEQWEHLLKCFMASSFHFDKEEMRNKVTNVSLSSSDGTILNETVSRVRRQHSLQSRDWEQVSDVELALFRLNVHQLSSAIESGISARNNKWLMMQAVQRIPLINNEPVLSFASESLKNNKDLVREAVRNNPWNLRYASQLLKSDKNFMLELLQVHKKVVDLIPSDLFDDRDSLLKALQFKPAYFKRLPPELIGDTEVFLQALKYKTRPSLRSYFNLLAPQLLEKKSFILELVKANGMALKYVNPEMKNDQDIVRAAAISKACSFQYASDDLRYNKAFVVSLLMQNNICRYVPESFLCDRDIALTAVTTYTGNFIHIDTRFKNDKQFVLAAVTNNPGNFSKVADKFKNDKEIVLSAIKTEIRQLQYASWEKRNNKEFMRPIIEKNGLALAFVSSPLKKDKELVQLAVAQNPRALRYADIDLQRQL